MSSAALLAIGDFSRATQLSVKMLRHYHQIGLEWTSLEAHRALFHDADGEYAGCTVAKGAPFVAASSFVPTRLRPVVPMA